MVNSTDPRYRYARKESDVGTTYDWFNPGRDCEPWRAGFNSTDSHASLYAWSSPYVYAGDNPISFLDRTGMDSTDAQKANNSDRLPPQGSVTLLGPQEVPLAPHGLAVMPPNPTSQMLSMGADILSGSSSILTGIGAGLVVGGLFTEGSTVPAGAAMMQMAMYTEIGSFGLNLLNYKLYNVGNPSEIAGEGLRVGFDVAFSRFSEFALEKVGATEILRGKSEILSLGSGISSFFFAGPSNPTTSAVTLGLQYVYPDVTSYHRSGW